MPNVTPMQMIVDDNLHTVYDDDSKKTREEIDGLLKKCLGAAYTSFTFKVGQKVVTGKYVNKSNETIYIIVANITFMGGTEGQHPKDLKRIQYNVTWREFYEKYSSIGKVLWMGLYSYADINVWAFFEPQTYLAKHEGTSMISKGGHKAQYSCHIYLNDLYQGYINNKFCKLDKNNNVVGSVRFDYLASFFDGEEREGNPIIEVIENINTEKVEWNKWITASIAIPYMKRLKEVTGFKQWKQNLWNGWYIEALYSEYLGNRPSQYIDYVATTDKQEVLIEYKNSGLDLAFPSPEHHFIGDLKAVCEGDGNTLLNDETKVKNALEKYKRIWFVIYIHEKKPGKTNDYEMVKWRNHFIQNEGEWDPRKEFNELSAPLTPHSVSFSEMVVIELNEITKEKYFSIGPQFGLNSDGNERNNKFKISKRLLDSVTDDNFVIYRYRPTKNAI